MTKIEINDSINELRSLTNFTNGGDVTADQLQIAKILEKLKGNPSFLPEALEANIEGISDGNWTKLGELIARGNTFSEAGINLIIAPYHVWRPGAKMKMSVLLCQKLDVESFPLNTAMLKSIHGTVDAPPIIPVQILLSAGNISGKYGETFIVPTAWRTMPNADSGSPLFDLIGAQERMVKLATDEVLSSLYSNGAESLIDFRSDSNRIMLARFWEYSLHEYGHALGHFSDRIAAMKGKMSQAALEEWRSDGVMVWLVQNHIEWGDITEEQGRDILMSNFLTRFGMDVVRGKDKIDHDVLASYFLFNSIHDTGLIEAKNGSIFFNGETQKYAFWRSLYANLADQGQSVTNEVRATKGFISEPARSEGDVQNFVKFISEAIDRAKPKQVTPTNDQLTFEL